MKIVQILANGLDLNATADILEKVNGAFEIDFITVPRGTYITGKDHGINFDKVLIIGHVDHSRTAFAQSLIIDDFHNHTKKRLDNYADMLIPDTVARDLRQLSESKKGVKAEKVEKRQQQRWAQQKHYKK